MEIAAIVGGASDLESIDLPPGGLRWTVDILRFNAPEEAATPAAIACTPALCLKGKSGKISTVKAKIPAFIAHSQVEPGCVYLAFTLNRYTAHCRCLVGVS